MSKRDRLNKQLKTGIIVLIILSLLATSTILVIGNRNNSVSTVNNTTTDLDPVSSGLHTDLYMLINSGCEDNTTASFPIGIGDSEHIYYTKSGSYHNFSLNETINATAYIFNFEKKNMAYNLVVYQAESDITSGTLNITPLYQSAIEPIQYGSLWSYSLNFTPAYLSNDSYIGIALFDNTISGESTIRNYTDIHAKIFAG